MFKFKKNIISTNRQSNFTDRTKYELNLDRNEKVIPFSKIHKKKLNKYFNNIDLNLYPNLKNSYKKLSKYLKINTENLLITEGVSGAIKNILDTIYIDNKIEIIVPKPSFALYKIYSDIYDFKVRTYGYDKNFNLNLRKIFNLVNKNTSVVFVTFPNIPVEGEVKLSFIKKLASFLKKKKILLVVDEVYYPFNKFSAIKLIKKNSNVLIMRSFSKAFGLAGARIGYMISNKNNIKSISKSKGGYETNILSAQAMNFVLDNLDITKKYVKEVQKGFFYLKNELRKLKIDFYGGSNSNFIFINLKDMNLVNKVSKKLRNKKIIVRNNLQIPFKNGLVIAGCPPKQMKKFILSFKKAIK